MVVDIKIEGGEPGEPRPARGPAAPAPL